VLEPLPKTRMTKAAMRLLLASLFLIPASFAAHADGRPTTCETQRDTAEMADCAYYSLGQAEAELGAALTDLRQRFPRTATQLDQAQASWAQYRDATCYYVADPSDYARGSESILAEIACKTTETRRRAAEVRRMFTD
jgi:uncharacterized protein YecT (DUF1311 family)